MQMDEFMKSKRQIRGGSLEDILNEKSSRIFGVFFFWFKVKNEGKTPYQIPVAEVRVWGDALVWLA